MEGTTTLTGSAPRTLHPLAWWGWAIGLGIAANTTTNPLVLILLATAMLIMVLARRSNAPWARSIRAYLILAGFVIGMRMVFQMVIGVRSGSTILFTLPEVPLPAWAAGITLGGPVTLEAVTHTGYDALRLAVLLFSVGAANALASPRQALRSVPAALYEASVAVVVALNVAPQLIESGQRVRQARRLRGEQRTGLRAVVPLAFTVLADAIDRSISLAAGMEARGFARTSVQHSSGGTLLIGSSLVAIFGGFLVLTTDQILAAWTVLIVGLTGIGWGLHRAGRRLGVTQLRQLRWGWRESLTVAAGLASAASILALSITDPDAVATSTDPLMWPQLPPLALIAVATALLPLLFSRPVRLTTPDAARADAPVRGLRPISEVAAR